MTETNPWAEPAEPIAARLTALLADMPEGLSPADAAAHLVERGVYVPYVHARLEEGMNFTLDESDPPPWPTLHGDVGDDGQPIMTSDGVDITDDFFRWSSEHAAARRYRLYDWEPA